MPTPEIAAPSKLTPAQSALAEYLHGLSEKAYSTGRTHDCEYAFWQAMLSSPCECGQLYISSEIIAELRRRSDAAGGWFCLHNPSEETFLSFDKWQAEYATWLRRNEAPLTRVKAPWLAFGYTVTIGLILLKWNRDLGYPLPETIDQGRWRGSYADFASLAWILGTPVYVAAFYGIVYFIRQIGVRKTVSDKVACAAVVLMMLGIVVALIKSGFDPNFLSSKALD